MQRLARALALSGALLYPGAAPAEWLDGAGELRLELFQGAFDSAVRFDSRELGLGTALDLERDLAMEDDAEAARLELVLRPGERHRVTLDYVAFDRSGSARIEERVQFGDVTFSASADVRSTLESRWAALGWGYAIWKAPAGEAGLSLSLAWLELEATLSGTGGLLGGPVQQIEERGAVEGPIPMLGAFGAWRIGTRGRIEATARYLEVSDLDGWSGSGFDYALRFDWRLLEHLAVGVGYGGTEIDADSEESDGLARADYGYAGPKAGITLTF